MTLNGQKILALIDEYSINKNVFENPFVDHEDAWYCVSINLHSDGYNLTKQQVKDKFEHMNLNPYFLNFCIII